MKSLRGRPRRPFFATLLAFVFAVAASNVAAQEGAGAAGAKSPEENSQSVVRGRVVYDDTGRPVRRAGVMLLTDLNHPAARRTVTNNRGEFRFGGVKAGTYFVVADAAGILSRTNTLELSDYGISVGEGGETRVTADGKGESRVEVRARRGGTITGRIMYGDEEPVTGGRIVLFRRRGTAVAPFFTDPVKTDDRGAYRVEGLPAGEYFVGVIERHAGGPNILPRDGAGLAAGYHPSAKSVREATAVRVEAGAETAGVNLTLAEERLPRVGGVVRWRQSRRPAEEATVMMRRKDDPAVEVSFTDLLRSVTPAGADKTDTMMRDMALISMAASNTPYTETDAEGRWSFEDVTPGTYLLTVFARLLPSEEEGAKEEGLSELDRQIAAGDRRSVSQQRELTVGAEDVGALTFEMTEGGRVSGTVSTEDGSAPPVVYIVLDYRGAHWLLNSPYLSNTDGTFLLEAVPAGEVRLDVRVHASTGYHVKSITAGGLDLLREPLRVVEGAEVGGVRVELARGQATVSGRVVGGEGGAPVGGAGVLLFPADEGLWHLRGARFFARADAEGGFTLGGAPGDYLALAWGPGQEPSLPLEEYVRSRAASARRVRLRAGEDKKIDLQVPAAPDTQKR